MFLLQRLSLCMVLAGFFVGSYAATQGSLGPTSSGTVQLSATSPVTPRQVLVANLVDVSVTNDSNFWGGSPTGGFDFCLVDTYGGTVSLAITSSQGTSGGGWALRSAGGSVSVYTVNIRDVSGAIGYGASDGSSSTFTTSLSVGGIFTNPATCSSGNNNYKFVMRLLSSMPTSLPATVYTDTVTLVVSPM
jgi:hypothetical protein